MRILYRDGTVYAPGVQGATAMLVDADRIDWIGATRDAPRADAVVDLAGSLVTPAFVDAHLHATDTGLALLGLDLSDVTSADDLLERVARHARVLAGDAVVVGHGWDESRWSSDRPPPADALAAAAGGRRMYLARVDSHSALASPSLLATIDVPAGAADEYGRVTGEVHHAVRVAALGSLSRSARRSAQETALRRAASLGIAVVCECGGPEISSEEDFTGLLALAADPDLPDVYGLWGELGGAWKARDLGAVGAGGDVFADGALGSRTAHLREPYADGGGFGLGVVTPERAAAHVVECVRAGVSAGFHAIGDAAVAAVLSGYELAAEVVGEARLRSGRHRVEHAELVDGAGMATMARLGLIASVQPAFDRLWGGRDGMYASRLGAARALAANPLAGLAAVGVSLAFGSDAPVTPLDPWGTVAAAVWHHNPGSRLGVAAAFAAHAGGGWFAVGGRRGGVLEPGREATFAVWDVPGGLVGGLPRLEAPSAEAGSLVPVCRRTVLRGRVIFEAW